MDRHSINYELELSAWKYYLRKSVRVYMKNSMLRVGKKSWWSRIKEKIPNDFADNFGRIREPWLTKTALWMLKHSLRVTECLKITVDNVVPSAISAVLTVKRQPES